MSLTPQVDAKGRSAVAISHTLPHHGERVRKAFELEVQKAREAAHAIEAAHMAEAARAVPQAANPLVTVCVRCEVPFPAECCPLALLRQPLQAARCPACYQDDMPEMPGYAGPFS